MAFEEKWVPKKKGSSFRILKPQVEKDTIDFADIALKRDQDKRIDNNYQRRLAAFELGELAVKLSQSEDTEMLKRLAKNYESSNLIKVLQDEPWLL